MQPDDGHKVDASVNAIYRFGPFRADTRRCALFRDATPVALNRKAFELLRVLIEHRGETVSRERLIELLWGERIVEESNLTQAIFVLRKALEDHPREARYIQTVARYGYRFIAPVEEVAEGADAPMPTSVNARRRVSRRGFKPAIAAGLSVAVALALLWWFVPWSKVGSDGATDASVRLAVLPFAAPAGDSELQLLAVSLTDLLSRRLGGQSDLLLFGMPSGLGSDSTPGKLLAFARQTRLRYMIGGKLGRAGNPHKARLDIVLYELDKRNILHKIPLQSYDIAFPADAAALERFVGARERIVAALLQRLLPRTQADASPTAMTPGNPAAYRLYLRALHHVQKAACSGPQAVALLHSSLGLDPDFAPAWETLGWAQYNLVTFCGRSAGHYADALRSADRALALAPDFPRAIALKVGIHVETGRIEEAYMLLSDARERLPWQPDLEFMRAYVLRYAGHLEQAAASLDVLLERDPVYLSVEGWTPNTLMYQGRLDDFLQHLPGGNAPIFIYYRALAKLMQGRREESAAMLGNVFAKSPNDPFAHLAMALNAILAGDEATALLRLNTLVLDRRRLGLSDGELTYKIAQLFVLAGDKMAALDRLDAAVEQGFFSWATLRDDPLLAPLHAHPRFRAILDKAKRRHDAFGRRFGFATGEDREQAHSHNSGRSAGLPPAQTSRLAPAIQDGAPASCRASASKFASTKAHTAMSTWQVRFQPDSEPTCP